MKAVLRKRTMYNIYISWKDSMKNYRVCRWKFQVDATLNATLKRNALSYTTRPDNAPVYKG